MRHASAADDYRPLSEPLVNIRTTIERAVERGLNPEQASYLLERAQETYYPHRSYHTLCEGDSFLVRQLEANRVDVKRSDARALLRRCAEMRLQRGTARAKACSGTFERVRMWHREVMSTSATTGKQLYERAQSLGLLVPLREELARSWFLNEWARERGIQCPSAVNHAFARKWESEHHIGDRPSWLRANGLTETEYLGWLEQRSLAEWLTTAGSAAFGVDSFLQDWAQRHGISLTDDELLKKGPAHLGYRAPLWDPDVAGLRYLQATGKAAFLL